MPDFPERVLPEVFMLPHNSIVSDLLISVLKEYRQRFPEGTSQEGFLKEYRQKYSSAVSFSWKPRPADSEGWRALPAAALNNSIIHLLGFSNVK